MQANRKFESELKMINWWKQIQLTNFNHFYYCNWIMFVYSWSTFNSHLKILLKQNADLNQIYCQYSVHRPSWPYSELSERLLDVVRWESAGVPALSAAVPEHEAGDPAEPVLTAGPNAAAGTGEPRTPAGDHSSSTSLFVHALKSLTHSVTMFQQISQHRELFIQMLNAPVGEGEVEAEVEAGEFADLGALGDEAAHEGYIQVTPQEKEAIDRVSERQTEFLEPYSTSCVFTPWNNRNGLKLGVDRLSAWPIIGADIKHFTDYRYRPF